MNNTLYESCKEWMVSHGYSNQQANSKAVIGVLDFIIQGEDSYAQYEKDKMIFNNLKQHIQWLTSEKEQLLKEVDELRLGTDSLISERVNEIKTYITEFYRALQECETPEARDRLKMLQMFVNTVDVETKYDNTAFINGIASILSGVSASVDKLQKVTADGFAQKKAYRTLPPSNFYWRETNAGE